MNFKYSYFFFVLWISTIQLTQGQTKTDNDSIAIDENIRYGTLPNGFTYYIKPLTKPHSKVEFKLWIKAGGLQEDPDQLDIAHDVEHMAFKASKHFPQGLPNEKKRIKKMGMRNLRDFGGNTAANYTQYFFNAPVGNKAAIETCFLWFKDIADGLKLATEDIDRERGVWRQEFILRVGKKNKEFYNKTNLKAQINPCSKDLSNFLEHNEKFSPKVLRRFYNDWYRPDLMGISIIGNIADMDNMENKVLEAFSGIIVSQELRKVKDCSALYINQPSQFAVVQTKMDSLKKFRETNIKYFLAYRDPKLKQTIHTMEGVKRKFTWQLLTDVLKDRFRELGNTYNQDFNIFNKYVYYSGTPLTYNAYNIKVTTKKKKGREVLNILTQKLHQMKRYGLVPNEWEQMKKKWLNYLKKTDTTSVQYWSGEIRNHLIYAEPLMANKQQKIIQWLKNLSLEKFNSKIAGLIKPMPEDIGIIGPIGSDSFLINEEAIRCCIKKAWKIPVKPYLLPKAPKALMSADELANLKQSSIIDKEIGGTGAKEIVLKNGVKVVLRRDAVLSHSEEDRIFLHGFSSNGSLCFREENYFSAVNAADIVRSSGAGKWNKFEIDHFISDMGNEFTMHPYIHHREAGINGTATKKNLENWFQLMYLYFNKPRKEPDAFEYWREQKLKEYYDPPYNATSFNFRNKIKEIMGDHTFYNYGNKLLEGVNKTNLEDAYNNYRKLFGNSKDFTFLISGNYREKNLIPLIKKYLGNLGSTKEKLNCPLLKTYKEVPESRTELREISSSSKETNNKIYMIKFVNKSKAPFNWKEMLKASLLSKITADRFMELRYRQNFSLYEIINFESYINDFGAYEISLEMNCEAGQLSRLRKAGKTIIQEIRKGKVKQQLFKQDVNFIKSIYSSSRYEDNRLVAHFKNEVPWVSKKEIVDYLEALSLNDIIETATNYYRKENQYEFIMNN